MSGSSTRARRAELADRRTRLVQYRIDGRTYEEIYEELGYASANAASKDFSRVLEMNIAEQHASLDVYRETELLRLDGELERLTALYERVEAILDEQHITISNGRVIIHGGETIPDWGPVLAAADRLIRIDEGRRKNSERRCKLLGLDAPQQVEVLTIDAINAEIARLSNSLDLPVDPGEAGTPAGPAETSG